MLLNQWAQFDNDSDYAVVPLGGLYIPTAWIIQHVKLMHRMLVQSSTGVANKVSQAVRGIVA